MKQRLHRIRREFLCAIMAFLLFMLMPHTQLKPISTPVVQAQGGEATFIWSDLQFDGSRYYYGATTIAEYATVNWRMYLADNINFIVNEVALVNVNVDISAFPPGPAPCSGIGDCATRCNNCVANHINNCKTAAIGKAIVAGGAFVLSL